MDQWVERLFTIVEEDMYPEMDEYVYSVLNHDTEDDGRIRTYIKNLAAMVSSDKALLAPALKDMKQLITNVEAAGEEAVPEQYDFTEENEKTQCIKYQQEHSLPEITYRRPRFPYADIYGVYGYLLILNGWYGEAQDALEKALKWNPFSERNKQLYDKCCKKEDVGEVYKQESRKIVPFEEALKNLQSVNLENEQELRKAMAEFLHSVQSNDSPDNLTKALKIMETLYGPAGTLLIVPFSSYYVFNKGRFIQKPIIDLLKKLNSEQTDIDSERLDYIGQNTDLSNSFTPQSASIAKYLDRFELNSPGDWDKSRFPREILCLGYACLLCASGSYGLKKALTMAVGEKKAKKVLKETFGQYIPVKDSIDNARENLIELLEESGGAYAKYMMIFRKAFQLHLAKTNQNALSEIDEIALQNQYKNAKQELENIEKVDDPDDPDDSKAIIKEIQEQILQVMEILKAVISSLNQKEQSVLYSKIIVVFNEVREVHRIVLRVIEYSLKKQKKLVYAAQYKKNYNYNLKTRFTFYEKEAIGKLSIRRNFKRRYDDALKKIKAYYGVEAFRAWESAQNILENKPMAYSGNLVFEKTVKKNMENVLKKSMSLLEVIKIIVEKFACQVDVFAPMVFKDSRQNVLTEREYLVRLLNHISNVYHRLEDAVQELNTINDDSWESLKMRGYEEQNTREVMARKNRSIASYLKQTQESYKNAIDMLAKALQYNEGHGATRLALAEFCRGMGDGEGFYAVTNMSFGKMFRNRDLARSFENLGDYCETKTAHYDAKICYKRSVDLNPYNHDVRAKLNAYPYFTYETMTKDEEKYAALLQKTDKLAMLLELDGRTLFCYDQCANIAKYFLSISERLKDDLGVKRNLGYLINRETCNRNVRDIYDSLLQIELIDDFRILEAGEEESVNDEKLSRLLQFMEGKITTEDNHYLTDKDTLYLNIDFPLERMIYKETEKPDKKIQWISFPFEMAYTIYFGIMIRKSDFQQAEEKARKALRWNPVSPVVRIYLAEILAKMGRWQESIDQTMATFTIVYTTNILTRCYLNLATCYSALGKALLAHCCLLKARSCKSKAYMENVEEALKKEPFGSLNEKLDLYPEEVDYMLHRNNVPLGVSPEIDKIVTKAAEKAGENGKEALLAEYNKTIDNMEALLSRTKFRRKRHVL